MTDAMRGLDEAVSQFWEYRKAAQQRGDDGDRGRRSAVTSGGQLDGIVDLVVATLQESLPPKSIDALRGRRVPVLPGYFRPEKEWDLVVMVGQTLGAVIELKSQVGPSFGNNFNNRAEEALGSADDLWTAFREGAFGLQAAPWAGYFFLLEDHEASQRAVQVREPIFKVFDEFRDASYALRYQILLRRMMRERRYTGTCLVMSTNPEERYMKVTEPAIDLSYQRWIRSLVAHLRGLVD